VNLSLNDFNYYYNSTGNLPDPENLNLSKEQYENNGQIKTLETNGKKLEVNDVEILDPEKEYVSEKKPLSMRDIKIGKIVINISTGKSGEPLERAMTILENISGQIPSTRKAKQTIRSFGIRRNEPIACLVTIRGIKAKKFLKNAFLAVGNKIKKKSFDKNGNFAFGIREHIDLPGQRYDPNLGIIGMDVMVTLERPGYRISRKRRTRSKIGRKHRVMREDAINFIQHQFAVEVS
jgi:large subunit ribosomal protein L5